MTKSKIFSAITFLFVFTFSLTVQSQVKTINLEQTVGEFTIKSLTLSPGDYQFEIANNGVDHEVGFVLTPKGKSDAVHHIKEAYVQAPVKNGSSSLSKVVKLAAGEYEYFCPLNPTDKYNLVVESPVQKISLEQTVGEFTKKNLKLAPGQYQFEIINNGVDHEVGFVLAPKGKTDAPNHIKEAYVQAPVQNGSSSLTQVVNLVPGEYEYFCPLNPTKMNTLIVE